MKIINLLPATEVRELKLTLAARQFFAFFSIVALSLFTLVSGAFALKVYIKSSINDNESQAVLLKTRLSSSNNRALEKEIVSLNTQIKNVKLIDQQHYYWSKALIELGNLSPSGCHFNIMSFNRITGEIQVSGIADNRSDVINFWSNVRNSSYFSDIDFPLPNLEKATDTPFTYKFHIRPESINQP